MSLGLRIELAFGDRSLPSNLIEPKLPISTEQRDALWFKGRSWKDVTWDEWAAHRDAIFAFTPDALAYFLPSILRLAIQHPGQWFSPADSLLRIFDRSPVIEYWDEFLVTRFLGLKVPEYEALKEWVLWLTDHPMTGAQVDLGRALDTIDMLQIQSNRIQPRSAK